MSPAESPTVPKPQGYTSHLNHQNLYCRDMYTYHVYMICYLGCYWYTCESQMTFNITEQHELSWQNMHSMLTTKIYGILNDIKVKMSGWRTGYMGNFIFENSFQYCGNVGGLKCVGTESFIFSWNLVQRHQFSHWI